MNLEKWAKVRGYEKLYQISDGGQIKSTHGRSSKIMKLDFVQSSGYRQVKLFKNGQGKFFLLHRLVAIHFINNPSPDRNIVNHKDGDKLNNKKSNLEWCTPLENFSHALQNGLIETEISIPEIILMIQSIPKEIEHQTIAKVLEYSVKAIENVRTSEAYKDYKRIIEDSHKGASYALNQIIFIAQTRKRIERMITHHKSQMKIF